MNKINRDFKQLKENDTFVCHYLFGGKIAIVKYTVVECYQNDGYVLASDGCSLYVFTENEFNEKIE